MRLGTAVRVDDGDAAGSIGLLRDWGPEHIVVQIRPARHDGGLVTATRVTPVQWTATIDVEPGELDDEMLAFLAEVEAAIWPAAAAPAWTRLRDEQAYRRKAPRRRRWWRR